MKYLLLILSFFIFAGPVFAEIPNPTNYINDTAHVLDPAFVAKENKLLKDYKNQTTNEVTVLTVDTTGDDSIEEYGIKVADAWKPGVKGVDNGVIILFAMKDHKMRIEVGRGVEDRLTDVESSDILDQIKPLFRESKYNDGVGLGVNEVIKQLDASASATTVPRTSNNDLGTVVVLVFIALAIGAVVLYFINRNGSDDDSDFSSGVGGGILGGVLGGVTSEGDSSDDNDSSFGSSSSSNSDDDDDSGSGGSDSGFGGFSGGGFSGGGASGGW